MGRHVRWHLVVALALIGGCGSRGASTTSTTGGTTSTAAVTSTTDAGVSTGPTTTQPEVTATAPTTTAGRAFGLTATVRLDAPVGGADGNLSASNDTVYAASGPEPAVRVAAVDLATGTLRWTTTLTESGRFGFSIGATSLGVLVPYGLSPEADAMKLTLLDRQTGKPVWTVDTEWLYEVGSGVNDHVAEMLLRENEPALVDLATGAFMPVTADLWASDGTNVVIAEGSTLREGPNPFDAATMRTTELGFSINEVLTAGNVVVLRSGNRLIGLTDAKVVWRYELPTGTTTEVSPEPASPGLIAIETRDESSDWPVLVELLKFDAAGVRAINGAPKGFLIKGMAHTSSGDAVYGELGPSRPAVLLVNEGSVSVIDASSISPTPDFEDSIAGLLVDQRGEYDLVLRSLPNLAEVVHLPDTYLFTSNGKAYIAAYPDEQTLSIYR